MKLNDAHFREAMDLAPDAMLLADEQGRILFANRKLEALLGYDHNELADHSIELLLPEVLRTVHIVHRAAYAAQSSPRPMGTGRDLHARRKDGSLVSVEISLAPMTTPGELVICAAVRDISERQRHEQLLIAARDAADKALRANSRFLAAASHDLRQPLQTLALLGHSLKRLVHEPAAAAVLESQANAVNGATRLLNKLLDISRLESGSFSAELDDYDARVLLKPLLEEFGPLAQARGLTLISDVPSVTIRTDPTYFDQLLRNLLSNALKFTRAGSITVRGVRSDHDLKIEVVDTGIGISAIKLPHIFEDFYQANRSSAEREGYGLGLGIVQRLSTLLSAKIEVVSVEGQGTTFTIHVPLGTAPKRRPSPAAESLADKSRANGSAQRILLVDDDAAVRSATQLLLELEGFDVWAASGLDEALSCCARGGSPALVVSDYHLDRDTTGLQVLQQVRARFGAAIPAVFVTGDTSRIELPPRDIALTEVLRKPVAPDILLSLIHKVISERPKP